MSEIKSSGVIYIAFGEKYIKQACHSAASFKKMTPNIPVALITDADTDAKVFDEVLVREVKHMRSKVDLILESPFENTLYLDSDTEVVQDISEVFQLLNKYDIAMAHCFTRRRERWCKQIPEYKQIPYAFSEFNGGVILFRKSPEAEGFFNLWSKKFHQYREITQGWDQASLRMTAWQSSAQIHTLPPEFNVRSAAVRRRSDKARNRGEEPTLMQPRILHWHGLEDKGSWRQWFSSKYKPYKF